MCENIFERPVVIPAGVIDESALNCMPGNIEVISNPMPFTYENLAKFLKWVNENDRIGFYDYEDCSDGSADDCVVVDGIVTRPHVERFLSEQG